MKKVVARKSSLIMHVVAGNCDYITTKTSTKTLTKILTKNQSFYIRMILLNWRIYNCDSFL